MSETHKRKNGEMKKCLVFAASNHYSYVPFPGKDVFVIAVDGGYKRLSQLKIEIDLLVGDFDSMQKAEIESSFSKGKIIELKKEKDETDTLYAIKKGIEKGCKEFYIFGGTGNRVDHTIANIQCLAYLAQEGARGFLYGKDFIMTSIKDGEIKFDEKQKGYVSMFSQTESSKGVCIEGLKYELKDAEVNSAFPIGVSNEFIGKAGIIKVRKGILLVVFPNTRRKIVL